MSTISVDQVTPSAGGTATDLVSGLAKAWWNVDESGVVSSRASLNVSSFTDVSAGIMEANLTSAMAAVTYGFVDGQDRTGSNNTTQNDICSRPISTSVARQEQQLNTNGGFAGTLWLSGVLLGDLA